MSIPRGEMEHYQTAAEREIEGLLEVERVELGGLPDEVRAKLRRDLMRMQEGCRRILAADPEVWSRIEQQTIEGVHLEALAKHGQAPTFQDLAIAKAAQSALMQWVRFTAQRAIPEEEVQEDG